MRPGRGINAESKDVFRLVEQGVAYALAVGGGRSAGRSLKASKKANQINVERRKVLRRRIGLS